MSDKLLIENYLLLLKSTVEVYVHGTLESSNESIRKLLLDNLNETLSMQGKTYDEMCDYGWYNVDNLDPEKIECSYDKIIQETR